MPHFKLINTDDIFESPMHEDNGVSIGYVKDYLLSKTAAAALNNTRPAGHAFTANSTTNTKWFDKFIKHTGTRPEYIKLARGKVHADRWYAHAVSF